MYPPRRWAQAIANDLKLEGAKSDIVEMEHMHLGHMEALKKKELVLAARTMSLEEFDQLMADRQSLIVNSTSEEPPANELIVDSPSNSDAPVDTPPPVEDEGGI
jgi:hypothetical protein